MRGCWRVPITATGRHVRSHLALHIELHLRSGDAPRGPRCGLADRLRMLPQRLSVYMGNVGNRGAGS